MSKSILHQPESLDENGIITIRQMVSDKNKVLNLGLVPWSINRVNPHMEIFTCNSKFIFVDSGQKTSEIVNILKVRKFLDVQRVILIVHGFYHTVDRTWMHTLKDAILEHGPGEKTICLCTWTGAVSAPPHGYLQAALNTKTLGKWLGELAFLIKKGDPSIKIWGIGHGIGAHTLGWCGYTSDRSVNRITGLDPAGPGYEEIPELFRSLSKDDATEMVDCIHTDGMAPLVESKKRHLGTLLPLGTIDFYPNFGKKYSRVKHDTMYFHTCSKVIMQKSVINTDQFKTFKALGRSLNCENPIIDKKVFRGPAEMGYYADSNENLHHGFWYVPYDRNETWL